MSIRRIYIWLKKELLGINLCVICNKPRENHSKLHHYQEERRKR